MQKVDFIRCNECGMYLDSATEYHPFAACQLMKKLGKSRQTRENIKAVVAYGMKAQKLGISLDDAIRDITKVR